MPIYSWRCNDCNKETEEILSVAELDGFIPVCEHCESTGLTKQLDIFCKTAMRWGTGHSYYNRGLGMVIENSQHLEQVMKERNLVMHSDLDKYRPLEEMESGARDINQHEKDVAQLTELTSKGVNPEQAIETVYSDARMLSEME